MRAASQKTARYFASSCLKSGLEIHGASLPSGLWIHRQHPLGQQFAPLVQQLEVQQLPGQHFADDLQHAAPVAARADRENSDAANRANSFVFMMEFLSV